MSLDKTIRENLDGKYLTIYTDDFNRGIEYAAQIGINQIHLIGISGIENVVDFKEFEKVSDTLQILSFIGSVENIINFESIYLLKSIKKINFQQKQNFEIDISKFTQIKHLGSEYWNGLINFNKANSLKSIVFFKFTGMDLKQISKLQKLQKLQILHIYSSKIKTLNGIETLPITELSLVRNKNLENIQALKYLRRLKILNIEKCNKIIDYELIESINDKVKISVI